MVCVIGWQSKNKYSLFPQGKNVGFWYMYEVLHRIWIQHILSAMGSKVLFDSIHCPKCMCRFLALNILPLACEKNWITNIQHEDIRVEFSNYCIFTCVFPKLLTHHSPKKRTLHFGLVSRLTIPNSKKNNLLGGKLKKANTSRKATLVIRCGLASLND